MVKKIKIREHLILATVVVIAWVFYYIIGIPSNYFQEWSFSEQILLSLITFFAAAPLFAFVIIIYLNRNYVKTGIWLAFYASFLLAIIDFIVCGIIQGGGLYIYISHWYLTLGYFYVWIIGPLMGIILQKAKKQFRETNTGGSTTSANSRFR